MLRKPKVYAIYFAVCFYTWFFGSAAYAYYAEDDAPFGVWFVPAAVLSFVFAVSCVVAAMVWHKNKWRLYRWVPEHEIFDDVFSAYERYPAYRYVVVHVHEGALSDVDVILTARQCEAGYVVEVRKVRETDAPPVYYFYRMK